MNSRIWWVVLSSEQSSRNVSNSDQMVIVGISLNLNFASSNPHTLGQLRLVADSNSQSHVNYRFVNKRGEKMLSVKAMVIISLAIDNESVFTMNLPYTSVNGCMVVDRKMRNS